MEGNPSAFVELGWLWFDNDPKTSLEDKLARAAVHYRQKFGRAPRVCYVRVGTLADSQARLGPVHLRSAANVLPGHFLFVVETELPPSAAR